MPTYLIQASNSKPQQSGSDIVNWNKTLDIEICVNQGKAVQVTAKQALRFIYESLGAKQVLRQRGSAKVLATKIAEQNKQGLKQAIALAISEYGNTGLFIFDTVLRQSLFKISTKKT